MCLGKKSVKTSPTYQQNSKRKQVSPPPKKSWWWVIYKWWSSMDDGKHLKRWRPSVEFLSIRFFSFRDRFFGELFVSRLIAFDLVLVSYKVQRFKAKIDVRCSPSSHIILPPQGHRHGSFFSVMIFPSTNDNFFMSLKKALLNPCFWLGVVLTGGS